MGKGHFACLGCNGYFPAGHWGGDGAAVAAPTVAIGGSIIMRKPRRRKPRRLNPSLLMVIKDYLENKLNDEID